MNKPAPKEPSMDEILSSIRQIIADDDAVGRRPSGPAGGGPALSVAAARPEAPVVLSPQQIVDPADTEDDGEPVALGPEAIIEDEDPEEDATAAVPSASDDPYADAELVEGDDVTFEPELEASLEPVMPRMEAPPVSVVPPPRPQPAPIPIPAATAAPMPDPTLSREIADQLLEPATKAAVKHTFARLGSLTMSAPGLTLEDMMRDMLRPMLKEWLDENLPSVVERMVEKEIERISRGGR